MRKHERMVDAEVRLSIATNFPLSTCESALIDYFALNFFDDRGMFLLIYIQKKLT